MGDFPNRSPRLVGCVRVYMPLEKPDDSSESLTCQAMVDMLAFLPKFSGMGVCGLLVKGAEKFLLEEAKGFFLNMRIVVCGFREGVELLYGVVNLRSNPVLDFYSKRGYEALQETDQSIYLYVAGSPAVLLFKDIALTMATLREY